MSKLPRHPATVERYKARLVTPTGGPLHLAKVAQPHAAQWPRAVRQPHAATGLPSLQREHSRFRSSAGSRGGVLQRMDAPKATINVEPIGASGAGLQGFVATVSNAHLAYYYVPDPRRKALHLAALKDLESIPAQGNPEWGAFLGNSKRFAQNNPGEQASTALHLGQFAGAFPGLLDKHPTELAPLRTLKQWYDFFAVGERKLKKKIPLMVNANWFSITGPANYPHLVPVTFLMGLSVRKGKMVSSHEQATEWGNKLDALAVFESEGRRKVAILAHHEIAERLSDIKFAVGGFSILEAGRARERAEPSASPTAKKRRTGVGISEDGRRIHLVVVETQITLTDFSKLFSSLGDHNAIDLDNAGSSQMVHDGQELTKPEDTVAHFGTEKRYRPIPNFFGVSPDPITKPQ